MPLNKWILVSGPGCIAGDPSVVAEDNGTLIAVPLEKGIFRHLSHAGRTLPLLGCFVMGKFVRRAAGSRSLSARFVTLTRGRQAALVLGWARFLRPGA